MDGDKTASGGTKSVSWTNADGTPITDSIWGRGRVLEETSYNTAGTPMHRTDHIYAAIRTADSPEWPSMTTRDAFIVNETQTLDRWTRADNTLRKTKVVRTVLQPADTLQLNTGVISQEEDQGDETTTTDSRCTVYDYTYNSAVAVWLLTLTRTRNDNQAAPGRT
jgi:hypothetical protein